MARKVKLILNPMADMGRAWKAANDLRPIAQEFRGDISWSGTVYPTHAMELAKQAAAEKKDAVFAAWSPPSVQSFHDAGAFRDLVFGDAH